MYIKLNISHEYCKCTELQIAVLSIFIDLLTGKHFHRFDSHRSKKTRPMTSNIYTKKCHYFGVTSMTIFIHNLINRSLSTNIIRNKQIFDFD